jgi:hypothetical protein
VFDRFTQNHVIMNIGTVVLLLILPGLLAFQFRAQLLNFWSQHIRRPATLR